MNASLLSPIKIKNFELKNRIVLPPMQVDLATEDGYITEKQIEHYKRYAPWCGLIIVEHTAVSLDGRYSKYQLGIWNDKQVEGFSKLVDEVHKNNGIIVIQLNHAGGKARREYGGKPRAPSSLPLPFYTEIPSELSKDEIREIIEKFGDAAERATQAGFDGIEIHGAHCFLLCQFWSPITNKRNDEYGGSLENRMRFPLEVVSEVKRRITKDMLLLYRLGVTDLRNDGIKIEDSIVFAKKLEQAGVDIIDISGGICGSSPEEFKGVQGYWMPYAYVIKKSVNIPIIGGGGIRNPTIADKFIREGKVDLVYVGRAQLDDPNWAQKAIKLLKKM